MIPLSVERGDGLRRENIVDELTIVFSVWRLSSARVVNLAGDAVNRIFRQILRRFWWRFLKGEFSEL